MKEINYVSKIHKKLMGELSESEDVLLQEWKNENEDNLAAYNDTVEIWKLSSGYSPKLKINVSKALEDQLLRIRQESVPHASKEPETKETVWSAPKESNNAKVVRLKPVQWSMRIAAIMVFGLCATFVYQYLQTESYTSGNQMEFVQLSDGSNIWLDEHSTLTVDRSFGKNNRSVTLQGKAFFDIMRDESKPFIIDANQVDVQVLGTSFTVDATNNTPSVAVKSGKVEVKTITSTKVITKGQKVESATDGMLNQSTVDINSDFDWTYSDLSFKDAPLSKVFSDVENRFDVKISYEGDVELDQCPFTSKSLMASNMEEVLDILSLTYDMDIDVLSNNEIKVNYIKCRN